MDIYYHGIMVGFFQTDADNKVTNILTAADIKLWIGDHDLGTTGETTLAEIQIRRDSER